MTNILEIADGIVNHATQAKERQYGDFSTCMQRATDIYNLMSPHHTITTPDMYKAMVAMKFAREAYAHKTDNLLDACAYIGGLQNYIDEQESGTNKSIAATFVLNLMGKGLKYSEALDLVLDSFPGVIKDTLMAELSNYI